MNQLEDWFRQLGQVFFSGLRGSEQASLSLEGEDQEYLRWNNGLLRQSTHVRQLVVQLLLQDQGRQVKLGCDLSGRKDEDLFVLRTLLDRAREEIKALVEDPFLVPMANLGSSHSSHSAKLPSHQELIELFGEYGPSCDFTGLSASGPSYRASLNSMGQSHWFETSSLFVDYSLFAVSREGKNKAVKATFATSNWQANEFLQQLEGKKRELQILLRSEVRTPAGTYRVFLAPAAVAELVGMLSWGAVSYGVFRRGQSAFQSLAEGRAKLSPKFSLSENFNLGVTPRFNSRGEVSPERIDLIEGGELRQWLISSRSAAEYKVESNFSPEHLRSPEIGAGDLPTDQALAQLGTGIYLGNLHYLNWSDVQTARITGMTRYACYWVENGEPIGPISDLRFDESLYHIFGSELEGVTREQHLDVEVSTYEQRALGGKKVPGMLNSSFRFTL